MEKEAYKIAIIGAGVSGLTAAIVLENHGYAPEIFEASDAVGGRVRTDVVEGYQLDRGFQVLLTAYPMVSKYLDTKALEVQPLRSGALIASNGKKYAFGDPTRDLGFLWSTSTFPLASFRDKLLIWKLNRKLKKESLEHIFEQPEQTTLEFLKDYGFSDAVINAFFKPFFSGIFLEDRLKTSSRMFCFVYKMFGEGLAVIPKRGIQAIPDQLKKQLQKTKIHLDSRVKTLKEGEIHLENGTVHKNHLAIVATEASALIPALKKQAIAWKSCDTLYFEVEKRSIDSPIIGLSADTGSLVNNIFYPNSIDAKTKGNHELLSVTVVQEHNLSESDLIPAVERELESQFGIQPLRHLKSYKIAKALPDIQNLQYNLAETETRLNSRIFLCGDVLLNASLNAAMISGEQAAMGIIHTLEDSQDLAFFTSEYL
ncbi:MAG: NAD(P)/FAD-dependent oxidoreductase [Bacteroidota bacterium]